LRWGDKPGLSRWAQYHHKGLYKKKRGRRVGVTEVRMEADVRALSSLPLKIEGATGQECRRPLETGKGKESDSPLEPLEGMKSHQYLDFCPVRSTLDF